MKDLAVGKLHITVFPRPGDITTTIAMGDTDWIELTNDGAVGIAGREVRREPVAKAVDLALASSSRLMLADGTAAVLSYVNSRQDDNQQKSGIYRRDLFYAINYAILQTDAEYVILHAVTNITAGLSDSATGQAISLTNPPS